MTEDQKIIWAAGFFDGEGCVAICRQVHSQSKYLQYQLQLSVCQKDPRPLEFFHRMFGGWFYSYKCRGIDYWRWVNHGSHAQRTLELLSSFLVVKAERAAIGIEFQKKLVMWNRDYGRRGYPDFVHQTREELYQRMKVLNQRGVSESNPHPRKPGPRKVNPASVAALRRRNQKSESEGRENGQLVN